MNLINVADIDTQIEYKNDVDRIASLCVKAFKKNIKIYISKEDFEANRELFFFKPRINYLGLNTFIKKKQLDK